jgi:hypothetical protein
VQKLGQRISAAGVVAALAAAGHGVAGAAEAGKGRGEPAVVAGARSMGADELARAGRAVEATPAVTIYQARLPDGTLELSDHPPTGAAGAVERRSYGLAPQDPATRKRAEAEREYWRGQADAFVKRQQERDREAERARRDRPTPPIVVAEVPRRAIYHGYGWLPHEFGGAVAGPSTLGISGTYTSSPGAVQGRSSGFIGSGFATAR